MSIIDIIWLYKLFDYGIIINDKKVHLTVCILLKNLSSFHKLAVTVPLEEQCK